MVDPADLEVLEIVYRAIGDPKAWLAVVDTLVKRFDADHGHLIAGLASPRQGPVFETAGLSGSDIARFQSSRAVELWAPFEKIVPTGRPILQAEVVSDRFFERSEFYNEIVRPTGGFHGMSYRQGETDDPLQLVICRARRDGEFDASDAERLAGLIPHLTRAFDLHRRLRLAEHKTDGLAAALNKLENGLMLLNRSGIIEFVNTAAVKMVEAPELWLAQARALEPSSAKGLVRLQDVICQVAQGREPRSRRLYLRDAEKGGIGLVINVELVSRFGFVLEGLSSSHIAIFMRETNRLPAIDKAALSQIYGLTRRETEIASILAQGRTIDVIAEKTDLTVNTVRFYLKQIFLKVGVKSQTSLVAILRTWTTGRD